MPAMPYQQYHGKAAESTRWIQARPCRPILPLCIGISPFSAGISQFCTGISQFSIGGTAAPPILNYTAIIIITPPHRQYSIGQADLDMALTKTHLAANPLNQTFSKCRHQVSSSLRKGRHLVHLPSTGLRSSGGDRHSREGLARCSRCPTC